MRRAVGISMILVSACLCSCGEQKLECGADAVIGTLSSMVRDRVLRVAADAYPASFDAAKRAALTKATRVTPVATKLIEWDATTGRLACLARLVVEAPGPEADTNLRSETELRYRVTRDDDETFFVEVAYAEMILLYPARAESGQQSRPVP